MLLRLCAALAFFTACVADQTDSQTSSELAGARDHRPPPPPEEAFAACADSTAGVPCAFDFDGHHVDGTCRNGPDGDGPLACAPNQPPPPPPAALDACANLALDDACAFDIDGHHVEGTCKTGPDGDGPLACAPDRR